MEGEEGKRNREEEIDSKRRPLLTLQVPREVTGPVEEKEWKLPYWGEIAERERRKRERKYFERKTHKREN